MHFSLPYFGGRAIQPHDCRHEEVENKKKQKPNSMFLSLNGPFHASKVEKKSVPKKKNALRSVRYCSIFFFWSNKKNLKWFSNVLRTASVNLKLRNNRFAEPVRSEYEKRHSSELYCRPSHTAFALVLQLSPIMTTTECRPLHACSILHHKWTIERVEWTMDTTDNRQT